jgi:importin subunit beta-1
MPLLLNGLKNCDEYQVCAAAVGCMGDLCRAVEAVVLPYCDAVVQCLLEALENPSLKRDVKPPMLSLLGDLALATGPAFQRYLAPPYRTMAMLHQASKTVVDPSNEELVDYLGELHEAVLEAYTGIVNGLADGGAAPVLFQVEVEPGVNSVQGMAAFFAKLGTCGPEDEVIRGAVGLIGDLAKNLGKPAAPFLTAAVCGPLLKLCAEVADEETGEADERSAEVVAYANEALAAAHAP